MNVFAKFPQLVLALLFCIVFNSCSKDTDLISGYIINSVEQKKDVSILFGNNFTAIALDEAFIINVSTNVDFLRLEKINVTKVSQQVNEVVVNKR